MGCIFENKVILITGASSGIGAGTAEHLANLGGSMVLVGRSIDGLEKIKEKCSRSGEKAPLIVQADITENSSPKKIIDETIKYYGKLDVLINNAGIFCRDSIETIDFEMYDKMMNTNLRAIITLTKEAVPYLAATKGCVVNISSVTGNRSFAGSLSYCLSKAALDQFTKCVALELASKGIRVNSVNPGTITSGIHKKQGLTDEEYAMYLEKSKQMHAMGRVGSVEEVVKGIAFLASDEASFTTGALLPIDGGRHAMTPR